MLVVYGMWRSGQWILNKFNEMAGVVLFIGVVMWVSFGDLSYNTDCVDILMVDSSERSKRDEIDENVISRVFFVIVNKS